MSGNMQDKKYPQRTREQNKALHLWFTMVADALNEAGYDLKTVLAKAPVDIPNSGYTVKENLWKPILKAQLGFDSTTEHDTKNVDAVYDTLNRFLGENFKIHVPFPDRATLTLEEYGKI